MSGEDRFDKDRLVGAGGFEPPESEDPLHNRPHSKHLADDLKDPAPEVPTPEEPVQRARVSRQFEAEVDLGGIELPDWEFITKVVELFQPYAAPSEEIDTFAIRGRDSRGTYSAQDLDAFREEHDQRGEGLETISIRVYGKDKHGLFGLLVHYSSGDYGRAEIEGGDEVMVNGLAAGVGRLAEAARARLKAKEEAAAVAQRAQEEAEARKSEPVRVSVSADSPIPTTTPDTPWWNNTWVVNVVGGLVVALVAALLIWLISSH